ncbi:MAG: peptidoglycan-binding domain-containing protein, partial [Planctomycetaceae bacterium]
MIRREVTMRILANSGDDCYSYPYEGSVSAWRIRRSVGRGGRNDRDDVLKIQKLLNLTEPTDGGPPVPLVEDGWIGPKTNSAIAHFQSVQQTGSDGRVDPFGPTLKRMNEVSKPRLGVNNAALLARVAAAMGTLTQIVTKGQRTVERAMDYLRFGDGIFSSKRDYEMADLYFDFKRLSQSQTQAALVSIRTTFRRAWTALNSPPSPVTGGNPLGVSIFTIDPLGHSHYAYVPTWKSHEKREHPDVHTGHVYLCRK